MEYDLIFGGYNHINIILIFKQIYSLSNHYLRKHYQACLHHQNSLIP